MKAHQLQVDEAIAELKTARTGLRVDEAQQRLQHYGPNEIAEKAKRTAFMMFLDQFRDFMILVLIAAAVISGVIGEPADTAAIVVIVLLNAVLGFSQEYRAEKAIEALRKMAASLAVVVRDGELQTIAAAELVPGDITLLEAGRIVPADMRMIEAVQLSIEEAALTGESLAVEKTTERLEAEVLPLGDRKNMAYKGTVVTYGRGTGLVVATGMDTELGRIASLIQGEEEGRTPLQKRLAGFGRKLAFAVLAICAVIFAAGLLRGEEPVRIFLVAVSLAVAAIPEALPAVVTIALALGARQMVKRNALIRRLPAVETLGSVTYICTDKTGTLTENRMTVEQVWVDGKALRIADFELRNRSTEQTGLDSPQSAIHNPQFLFFAALALSNDARTGPEGEIIGDPTEAALFVAARDCGLGKAGLEALYPRTAELPFDSDRKLMTTVHRWREGESAFISFTKGAAEVLLERATSALTEGGVEPLDRKSILAESDAMAAAGLRVMAVAMRTWTRPPAVSSETIEQDMVLLGLVGMMDPPREEAKQSVDLCKSAGIIPVMITGDHPLTARTIAARVGILENDEPAAVITGSELESLTLEEFERRVEHIRVYARVAPEQKLKIVRALQDKGHFVAMTGDGVNDAPALKRADIGVSMGVTGTDVAKEASSMILLDDNFATIVRAVREGRKIYDNIRKFIKYLLTTNSGEIWTLFLAPFLGLPIPLQPVHILWINLVTDGLPALALSMEPEEGNVMQRPPRSPRESLFARGLGIHAIWVGLLMAAVALALQAWAIHVSDAHWQTMVFTVLCLTQLGHVLAIRSERESLFTRGVLSNKPLFLTVFITVLFQLATVYVPALHSVFKTQSLSISELMLVLVLSCVVFAAVEIEKLVKRVQKIA